MFFFAWWAQGPDAGIFAGQSAAGMGQAPEIVGERLGGTGFLDSVLRDGEQVEGARAVDAGSDLLGGSSHKVHARSKCTSTLTS